MQAVCDAHRQFIFVSILSAGSTHDSAAWELSSLARCMADPSWPYEHWLVGDAAYPASDFMITPFLGRLLDSREDSFNFYQSRIRINIECAFGLLWKIWLILQSPLQFSLPVVTQLITVLCKLTNIITSGRVGDVPEARRPLVHQDEVAAAPGTRTDLHHSSRRDRIADLLADSEWVRPAT